MLDTKIQTPISTKVLTKARKKAANMGFGSINDVIRIIIKQFAEDRIRFSLTMPEEEAIAIPSVSNREQNHIKKLLKSAKNKNLSKIVKTKSIDL